MKPRMLLHLGALLSVATALLLAGGARGQGTATLRCHADPPSITPAGESTLVIELDDVSGLYGYQLELNFPPDLIRVLDEDPHREGVNLALGEFLPADFVALNEVDQTAGKMRLAVVELAPDAPRSGSGELARATLDGLSAGRADFAFNSVILSDREGNPIAYNLEGCSLQIGAAATGTAETVIAQPSATIAPAAGSSATPAGASTGGPGAPAGTGSATRSVPSVVPSVPATAWGAQTQSPRGPTSSGTKTAVALQGQSNGPEAPSGAHELLPWLGAALVVVAGALIARRMRHR